MQTKDPALTKTLITDHNTDKLTHPHIGEHHQVGHEIIQDDLHHKGTETLQETVLGTLYTSDHIFDEVLHEHDGHHRHHNDGALAHNNTMRHDSDNTQQHLDDHENLDDHKNTDTFQETVVGSEYIADDHLHDANLGNTEHHKSENMMANDNLDSGFLNNNDFQQGNVVHSEHVNEGDEPARYPDRRDQDGNAFDKGINEHTVSSEAPKSEHINDMNRYASIDNAQTRVLNPDEKD